MNPNDIDDEPTESERIKRAIELNNSMEANRTELYSLLRHIGEVDVYVYNGKAYSFYGERIECLGEARVIT